MNIDFIINLDLAITTEIYKYLVKKYTLANGAFSSGKAGMKFGIWADELHRQYDRLIHAEGNVCIGSCRIKGPGRWFTTL